MQNNSVTELRSSIAGSAIFAMIWDSEAYLNFNVLRGVYKFNKIINRVSEMENIAHITGYGQKLFKMEFYLIVFFK